MSEPFNAESAFLESFETQLAEHPPEEWVVTGRPSKVNPHGEDAGWWRAEGPKMVQRWMEWCETSPWEIWIAPDGQPGIELEINVLIDGYQPIKMFVDCVFATGENNTRPVVLDIKTGVRIPDNTLQLGLYKVGLELQYPGVKIAGGCYWMGRTGLATGVYALPYTAKLYAEYFRQLRVARQTGVFMPKPSSLCKSCKVGRFCAVNNGADAHADPDFQLMGG